MVDGREQWYRIGTNGGELGPMVEDRDQCWTIRNRVGA
jgi:hypothetical protein